MTNLTPNANAALEAKFGKLIAEPWFPCVGAKSALARGGVEVLVARDITSAWDDLRIHERLMHFAAQSRVRSSAFQSFAVLFHGPLEIDEAKFEASLWARMQSLADKDGWLGQAHDPRVSDDPEDPHFALSFGGEGFFAVGLHPGASRPARRFSNPAIVFNPHEQFQRLRVEGTYERLRERTIARDIAFAGSANPMLARHGETSEARQYSGRRVGEDWRCPFRPAARKADVCT